MFTSLEICMLEFNMRLNKFSGVKPLIFRFTVGFNFRFS